MENKNKTKISKKERIPLTSWFCSDFPRDLCNSISDYAKNDNLSNIVKLRNVLQTIAKFYNTQIEKLTDSLQNCQEKLEETKEIENEFLVEVESILYESSRKLTFNDIIEILRALCEDKTQIEQENEEIKGEHSRLLEKIEAGTSDEAVELLNKRPAIAP